MRELNKLSEKIVIICFVSFTLCTSGFLISLIIVPFLHPEVNTPHLQIFITKDADFDKYNFPGSGTPTDPFLIENFTYQEDGLFEIYIFGVSKHFVIRNNIIIPDRADEAIRIGNAPNNVSIINNVVYGSAYLHYWNLGISVYNVNDCNIINNSIFFEEKGIQISHSSNCLVKNNKLIKNVRNIEIIDSPNILIENNSLVFDETQTSYPNQDMIYVQNSDNISIINNQLDKSGIFFNDGSIKTAIIENNFIDGLKIGFFRNITNFLINSTTEFVQILLADCKNCSLYNLNMSKSNVGIGVYNSNLINCSYCNLNSNPYGLYIYESTNVTIAESIFLSNDIGTRVKYSDNIRFLNNNFQENSFGIYLSHSSCTFFNNSFINNSIDILTYDY